MKSRDWRGNGGAKTQRARKAGSRSKKCGKHLFSHCRFFFKRFLLSRARFEARQPESTQRGARLRQSGQQAGRSAYRDDESKRKYGHWERLVATKRMQWRQVKDLFNKKEV